MEVAERDVTKAQNLITYEKEIFSRPAKQWFQSEKDKKQMEGVCECREVFGSVIFITRVAESQCLYVVISRPRTWLLHIAIASGRSFAHYFLYSPELGKRAYEGEDVAAEASGKLKKAKTDAEEGAEHPALLEGVKATNAEKQARTRKQKRALAAKLQDDNTVCGVNK